MDFVSAEKRSKIMRGVKSKNTRPERRVRSLLHRLGYRFRLHDRQLPGEPDIILPRHRTAIFVHGCFWHNHAACPGGRMPTSNTDFWEKKIGRTKERDRDNATQLEASGWKVVVVWECELGDEDGLISRLNSAICS